MGAHPELTIVLDRLRSSFNAGNIFRLADAVRAKEVICCGYTPAPPHPKLARSAMGADKTVPFRRFDRTADAVRDLKRAGCCVLAVEVSDSSTHVWDYPCCFPLALVFGNEALGVDPEVCAMCDGIVSLPMFGAKTSVNVGNCAAAVLYSIIEKYEFRSPAE